MSRLPASIAPLSFFSVRTESVPDDVQESGEAGRGDMDRSTAESPGGWRRVAGGSTERSQSFEAATIERQTSSV